MAGGLNTYAYVENNPLNWSDPYGLFPVPVPVPILPPLIPGNTQTDGNFNFPSLFPDTDYQDTRPLPDVTDIPQSPGLVEGPYADDPWVPKMCPPMEMAKKKSKASQKERSTDVPSYTKRHDPKRPDENCHQYATRVLKDQYGSGHPKVEDKGPRSEYNKLVKNCVRGQS